MRRCVIRWLVGLALLISLGPTEPAVWGSVLMDQTVQAEDVTLQIRLEQDDDGVATVSNRDRPYRLTVEAKREGSGAPLAQWWPGAWIDWSIDPLSGSVPVCAQRIARYLGGSLLSRPLVDLTGSYVVTLDREPSLSILDPSVNFAGRSSLYRSISLPAPAADWAATPDDRWLMLAVPEARTIVVVETGLFTIAHQIKRPRHPVRITMQPNSRLAWISEVEERSHHHAKTQERQRWLTAVDTATWSVVESFPVGEGLSLVTFAANGPWAYAVSPSARRLTMIDTSRMVVHRTVSLDFSPTGLAAVPQEPALWLVDGKKGRVVRFDAEGHERDRMAVAPTLEWASISPDGRWVLVATPSVGLTAIAAAPPHRMVAIPLAGQPADLLWTDRFAYVLVPDQGALSLFSWPSLGEETIPVKSIAIGDQSWVPRPAQVEASSFSSMVDGKGVFIAHPTERTIYTYMEGMNAPTQGVRASGHTPMAVRTVRRTFQEVQPGVYRQWVRLPASTGRLVLAIAGESPPVRVCVGLPALGHETTRPAHHWWQWIELPKLTAQVAQPITIHLTREPATEQQDGGPMAHVTLRVMRARGGLYDEWPMRRLSDRPETYEATGTVRETGTFFLYPTINGRPSLVPGTLLVEERAMP